MTNSEALAALIWIENVPANAVAKALIDSGLTGSDTYSIDNKDLINSAALSVLSSLPVSSISEGGYSITYDQAAIQRNITALGGSPKVRGVKCW